MTEKDILYSILGREIDNLLAKTPSASFLSGIVKNWVFKYIDPYVNLFMEGEALQEEMAAAFVQEEMSSKIENFKKRFQQEVENERIQCEPKEKY